MFAASFVPVVAVVGSKKSGKTLTIETLTRGLSRRGYRVATVKHIPKHNFTIDKQGTDTWRHAKAGARTVVSVAPEELAIINKADTGNYDLTRILMECGEDIDVIIMEGFKGLVEKNSHVMKIVAVKDPAEVQDAAKRFSPILAYVGSAPEGEVIPSIEYINIVGEGEKLVSLVHERVEAVRSKLKSDVGLKVLIEGKSLPCARFVQKIIKESVLAMVSTLKGTNIKGDEEVQILIRSTKSDKLL